jgi:hypothetical protein
MTEIPEWLMPPGEERMKAIEAYAKEEALQSAILSLRVRRFAAVTCNCPRRYGEPNSYNCPVHATLFAVAEDIYHQALTEVQATWPRKTVKSSKPEVKPPVSPS